MATPEINWVLVVSFVVTRLNVIHQLMRYQYKTICEIYLFIYIWIALTCLLLPPSSLSQHFYGHFPGKPELLVNTLPWLFFWWTGLSQSPKFLLHFEINGSGFFMDHHWHHHEGRQIGIIACPSILKLEPEIITNNWDVLSAMGVSDSSPHVDFS